MSGGISASTLAYVSIAATVASMAMQAYGQYQQGQNVKRQNEYQSAVLSENAKRAEYMAQDALDRGKIAESQQRLKGRLILGQMRTALASNGADINEGSAAEIQVDQAGINELDALTVRNNAEREAQNYRIQAGGFTNQAGLYSMAGENAESSGNMGAAGSLISGAGSVAGKWYTFNKDGAFGTPANSNSFYSYGNLENLNGYW